jgi:hypothetical protein
MCTAGADSADRTSRFNSGEDFATLELPLPLPQREGDSFTGAVPKKIIRINQLR